MTCIKIGLHISRTGKQILTYKQFITFGIPVIHKIHSRGIGIFTYIAFSRSFKKEGASSSSSSESSRSKSMSKSLCLSPAAIKAQFSRGHKKITQVHVNNPSWITIHQLMYYKHDKCCYFFLLHDKHLSTAKHFIKLQQPSL